MDDKTYRIKVLLFLSTLSGLAIGMGATYIATDSFNMEFTTLNGIVLIVIGVLLFIITRKEVNENG